MGVRIIRWRNIGIILGVIIAIAVITICVLPLVTVPYVVDVSYEDTETYYVKEAYIVQEPYTWTETYTEREPYNKSVPIDYQVIDKRIYNWFWSTGSDVSITIRNTDVKSGTFSVKFYLTLKGGATTTKKASKYIALGDTEEVQVKYSGGYVSTFSYDVTPPTKTVVDYRDVEKTRQVTEDRDVTKYRDVPKQRTVTKHRQETRHKKVTVLEYLINYA